MHVLGELRELGVARGDLVGLVVAPDVGVAMATSDGSLVVPAAVDDPATIVRCVEEALRPRWVTWSNDTVATLVEAGDARGVRVATCWDIAAVQRLIVGGWRADPAGVWAQLHDLATDAIRRWRRPTSSAFRAPHPVATTATGPMSRSGVTGISAPTG